KVFDEIDPSDTIFTLNPETGFLEESGINRILSYDYKGEMVSILGRRVDSLVTPNHRVLYIESQMRNPRLGYIQARQVLKRATLCLPLANGWNGAQLPDHYIFPNPSFHWNAKNNLAEIETEDLFYLIGLFVADGVADETNSHARVTGLSAREYVEAAPGSRGRFQTLVNTTGTGQATVAYQRISRVRYCVPKDDKARTRLESTLGRNGIHFSSCANGDDEDGIIQFHHQPLFELLRECGHSAREKHIPGWALEAESRCLSALFDGIMDGDGDKSHKYLTTTSPLLVRDIAELSFKLGHAIHVHEREGSEARLKDGRQIRGGRAFQISVSDTTPYLTNENFHRMDYEGKVWCLETDNGNFLVERNGTFFFSGNSMAIYGRQKPPFDEKLPRKPEDPYAAAKTYCENMLDIFSHTYDFEHVILRPHNVYGPRQNIADPYRNVLGIWINRILRGKPPIIYGDGKQTRAFSYIDDVTPAIANAGLSPRAKGQIINVGSDQPVSVGKACSLLLDVMSSELKPQHENARPGEVKHAYSTVNKSTEVLGYETKHSLKEGLGKMVEWARQVGPQQPTYTLPLEITKGAPRIWVEKAM
ncbi:MAG TPA: NAD-dependent epimerase/dehydratase family protein, partial [Candidatus Sulfotelmatobacter sp.]|nr:NAD-dependent epimerase/dehydratase family protein [Candidatus Sulfotelmatobacter sp.]